LRREAVGPAAHAEGGQSGHYLRCRAEQQRKEAEAGDGFSGRGPSGRGRSGSAEARALTGGEGALGKPAQLTFASLNQSLSRFAGVDPGPSGAVLSHLLLQPNRQMGYPSLCGISEATSPPTSRENCRRGAWVRRPAGVPHPLSPFLLLPVPGEDAPTPRPPLADTGRPLSSTHVVLRQPSSKIGCFYTPSRCTFSSTPAATASSIGRRRRGGGSTAVRPRRRASEQPRSGEERCAV